jgi:dipeptidyl aminopeptidase/acylaminoacyl peptidase
MKQFFLTILFLIYFSQGFAQSENASSLQIREIMQGEHFVGYLPEDIRWSEDGRYVFYSSNPDFDTLRSTYKVDISTKESSKLTLEELKHLPSSSGEYNKSHTRKAFEKNGDIFLIDLKKQHVFQITNTSHRESDPSFSGDEKQIIYRQENNLYSWDIENGSIVQLTDFKSDSEKDEPKQDVQRQWLEQDQLANFDILQKRKDEKRSREYRSEQIKPARPKSIFLGKKQLASMGISLDLHFVVYQLIENGKDQNTIVPDYVTQSGYTTDLRARSKVGSGQNKYETWIYNIQTDSAYQVGTNDIPGIYDKPQFLKDYAKNDSSWTDQYKDAREVVVNVPEFSDDGKAVVVVRSQDNKDRWIMRLNLTDGGLTLLDRQHDEAWIGGPGISGWSLSSGNLDWIDNEKIWYQSEETGYSHIYVQNVNTGEKKALTSGEFEIREAALSHDRRTFYITSNKQSPHEQHFYHLPVTGGEMKKITSDIGGHEVNISPDEKMLAIRFSTSNKPWELYVMPNKPGAKMEQLTHSTTDAFESYSWRKPEIVRFDARDGTKVPARLYRPEKANGAGVIFVHGAGYLQNVHEWWSSYYREYMFHNLLVDNGYTVLDIDYRASDGYGRDWRTGIYRFMGGKDLDDQLDGAKYLTETLGCDQSRLGIYGGSYGGFMTLMAMFTAPGTFNSGAALRSVTDWAHYNHGYTSNILNTPAEDSIAYAKSSPIYHAEGLEGNLLMLHGMVDTNVHFQDVVRLSQRLIELEKENWELAVFPMENHGFVEASSWADEYRRIFDLFQKNLR